VKNFFSCMAYSTYLRNKRESKNLSQQKLADLITARGHNVTAGSISNIERAYYKRQDGSESQPDKMFVILAAEVLEDDVDAALVEADYAPLSASKKPETLSELLEILERLGVENLLFADHDKLRTATPEDLQAVLEAVQLAVEVTLNRRRNYAPNQNSPQAMEGKP
jgi:transcriptional regulator with XRE-family HTH domain